MVDFAIEAERSQHKSAAEAAARQAALLGFRPIMMTTFAAMLAGVPLMLVSAAPAPKSASRSLGYACAAMARRPTIVSQALTLFTTPVIYVISHGLSDRVRGWRSWFGRKAPAHPQPTPVERTPRRPA